MMNKTREISSLESLHHVRTRRGREYKPYGYGLYYDYVRSFDVPGPVVREGTLARRYDGRQLGAIHMSLPEGLDRKFIIAQKPHVDESTDRRIVHHLRRKLNKRMERRFNKMFEKEIKEEEETQRKPTPVAPTPINPFKSYTEFGDKIRKKDNGISDIQVHDDVAMRGKSGRKSALKYPMPLPDITKHDRKQNGGDESGTGEMEEGVTFGMTGMAGDIEPFVEDIPVLEREEIEVSPVPTPSLLRPETRHGHVTLTERRDRLLEGDMTLPVNPVPPIIRVYLQANDTDSDLERQQLIETTYTKLRGYSQERGYDLHLIDLHWGQQVMLADDHSQVKLVSDTIERCNSGAACVNFVILLGQKLGPYLLPTDIEVSEFEAILRGAEVERSRQIDIAMQRAAAEDARRQLVMEKQRERLEAAVKASGTTSSLSSHSDHQTNATSQETSSNELKSGIITQRSSMFGESPGPKPLNIVIESDVDPELLNTWYKLDENSKPPVYKLQPISSIYKDIFSADLKRRSDAFSHWHDVCDKLRHLLRTVCKQVFSSQDVHHKYMRTLADVELEQILSRDRTTGCYWLQRHIDDLHLASGDVKLRDYMDVVAHSVAADPEKQRSLDNWTNYELPQVVKPENRRKYKIPWNKKGVTLTFREHVNYIERLSKDITNIVNKAIDNVVKENSMTSQLNDALYREVEQHVHYCQIRARSFFGRKLLLSAMKKYIRSNIPYPFVVYGKAGAGKTYLLSKAARDCHKWIEQSQCSVLVRMIGVTSQSRNVRLLLRSLCLQLCEIFGDNPEDVPDDYNGLFNNLSFKLTKANEHRQLILFIDSLHLITDENDGRNMVWFPKELPPYVHVILTTLPDDRFGCMSALQRLIPDVYKDCFLEVSDMTISEGMGIFEHWLNQAGRSVTKEQRDVVLRSFRSCPQPLYLRALYGEAVTWSSWTPATALNPGAAVRNIATVLLGRLERIHGEPLIRRALGYITASKAGLTDSEIEDLLSLDDAVSNDVMQHNNLAIRRVPSILWSRVKLDLADWLIETISDDYVTLNWAFMDFQEAVIERYLNNKDKAPSYHKALAEYFSDMWTNVPKPYHGDKAARRFTLAHPLYRIKGSSQTRVYNLRRLNELPYHFLNSQQMPALKQDCLCNFEFILAKISATGLRSVLEDYQMALKIEPTDLDLKLLSDALHLSMVALTKDPRQLASQIIGRMHDIITADVPMAPGDPVRYPALKPFFEQAKKASIPALIPSITCLTPPGGVLFDLLSGHTEPITTVCMSPDGQKCMTSSLDNTMKLWELRSGRVLKTLVGVGANVRQIRIGGNYAIAVTSEKTKIRLWSIRSGDCLKSIDSYEDPADIVLAAEGMLLVAFYHGTDIMRVWGLGGKFSLLQEVFLSEETTSAKSVHQDQSTIVGSTAHGPLVLHAYRSSSEAYVRNAKNGNVVSTLKVKDSGCITAMACSPEYFVLAVKYEYMEVHEIFYLSLFDNRSGKYIRDVRGCVDDDVTELFINHMGSHALAVCTSEANNTSEIAVWNIETEEHKHVARHAKVSRHCGCIDLRYCLTAADDDNSLRIWNLSTMVNQSGNKAKVKNGLERIILMTDNSRYVVSKSSNNGPIAVWNIAKGKCAGKAVHIERGLVNSSDIMLVRNTKVLILTEKGFSNVSEDRPPVYQTMLIYDLLKKKYTQKLFGCYITPSPPHEYVFLSDEQFMGLADNRSHLVVWSTVTGHVTHRIKPSFKDLNQQTFRDSSVELEERRKRRGNTAKMTPWDRRTERQSARERRHQEELANERRQLEELQRERENIIQQFRISKDLSTVVTAHYAHHLCVFDIPSQSHIQTLENPNSIMILYISALTESGSHLVHVNYDEEEKISYLTLWDVREGYVRKRLRNERNVMCVDISADAKRVVFGKSTKELRIWEPMSRGDNMRRIHGYPTLNFGVDSEIHMIEGGRKAIVYAGDISVWDLEKAEVLGVFSPDMRIRCFTPAMGGKMVVFGLQDTSDIVTLRLMSSDHTSIEATGSDMFGEVASSDDDDDSDMEAQLDREQEDD